MTAVAVTVPKGNGGPGRGRFWPPSTCAMWLAQAFPLGRVVGMESRIRGDVVETWNGFCIGRLPARQALVPLSTLGRPRSLTVRSGRERGIPEGSRWPGPISVFPCIDPRLNGHPTPEDIGCFGRRWTGRRIGKVTCMSPVALDRRSDVVVQGLEIVLAGGWRNWCPGRVDTPASRNTREADPKTWVEGWQKVVRDQRCGGLFADSGKYQV